MGENGEGYQNMDGNAGLSASATAVVGGSSEELVADESFSVIAPSEATGRQLAGAGLMVGGALAGAFAYGQMGWMMTTGWLVWRMGTAKI